MTPSEWVAQYGVSIWCIDYDIHFRTGSKTFVLRGYHQGNRADGQSFLERLLDDALTYVVYYAEMDGRTERDRREAIKQAKGFVKALPKMAREELMQGYIEFRG